MTLRERLKTLPQRTGSTSEPNDFFINYSLKTTIATLEIILEDLKENEPDARYEIRIIENLLDYLPANVLDVEDIENGRVAK